MRAFLAIATLLPLVAGCVAQPEAASLDALDATPVVDPRVPLVWDLEDCEAMTWQVLVPTSRLNGRLPEGFEPAPSPATAPVPDGIEQVSVLGFEAVECAQGFGSAEQVARSIPYARLYTPVVPPRDQADTRAGASHAYTWAVVVADDAWRARLQAVGLPVHDGGTLVGPSAQGYTARLAIDRVGAFSLTGRPEAQPRAAADVAFRDFTAASTGVAAWVGTMTGVTVANGVGIWDVSPESWVAQVLGTTSGVATFQLSRFSVPHEAVIRPDDATGEPFMGPRDD